MKRGTIFNIAKIALAVALLAYVIHKAGWDNIKRAITDMTPEAWILGATMMLTGNVLSIVRWQMLMKGMGLQATVWDAIRLGFIGIFFNNVVPGLTGGDAVKAVFVARENPGRGTDAVVSVFVDRLIGIVSLALISAVVIPLDFEAYKEVAVVIYGFLAAAAVGAACVLSRRFKAKMKKLLPGAGSSAVGRLLIKVDGAVSIFRHRIPLIAVAVGMSVVVHLCIIVGVSFFGGGIAIGGLDALAGATLDETAELATSLETLRDLDLQTYCSLLPIIFMIQALPISPGGLGVGEKAFEHFFGTIGVLPQHAVAISFTYRVTAMVISLIGGLFLLMDRKRVLEDVQAASADGEEPDAPDAERDA